MNKGESVAGESEWVPIRVKEESKSAILIRDVVDVGGVSENLKNSVPITVVIIDPRFSGEESVDDS